MSKTSADHLNKLKPTFPLVLSAFLLFTLFVTSYFILRPKKIDQSQAALLGDVNGDGVVNILDFQLLSNSFGKSEGQNGYNPQADFNGDSTVNILDFQILSNNFGKTGTVNTPTPTTTQTTPTPTTTPAQGKAFSVMEDAYVASENNSSNYGSADRVIASDYDSNVRTSYLKFNIGNNSIQTAELRLTAALSRAVEKRFLVTSSNWSENTINYSNRPSLGSNQVGYLNRIGNALSVGEVVRIPLDATKLNPDSNGNITIAIDNAGSGNTFSFNSKEAGNGAQLLINGANPLPTNTPTPTTPAGSTNTPTLTKAPTPTSGGGPTPTTPPPPPPGSGPQDCRGYPEPRTFLESQAWWWKRLSSQTGDDFGHVHFGTCFPHGQVVSGNIKFKVRLVMHHNPGVINNVHTWQNIANVNLTCPGTQTCVWWYENTLDVSKLGGSGRNEVRFHTHMKQPDGNELFPTTGWQLYINSKSGSNETPALFNWVREVLASPGRDNDIIIGRGWYTGSEYQNTSVQRANISSADPYTITLVTPNGGVINKVSGVWRPIVSARPGSGGSPTDHHIVMVDPAFHAHPPSEGWVIKEGSGELRNYQATIDTTRLSNGWHKLAIRADADDKGLCDRGGGNPCDSTLSSVTIIYFYVQN